MRSRRGTWRFFPSPASEGEGRGEGTARRPHPALRRHLLRKREKGSILIRSPPPPPCRLLVESLPRRVPRAAALAAEHRSIAATMSSCASRSPRWSSIIAADQICPTGLAIPCPAMSGAEPCTGSNSEGKSPVGLMLPDGAMRSCPCRPAEVREDIAEEVRGHHHVEPVRMQHEMRGQDVDVELVDLEVRIALVHLGHALVQ